MYIITCYDVHIAINAAKNMSNYSRYEQEYGIWTVSDNDRKLIKFDISLIYVVILWPNGWLVC
jgi:hypothetical protein